MAYTMMHIVEMANIIMVKGIGMLMFDMSKARVLDGINI